MSTANPDVPPPGPESGRRPVGRYGNAPDAATAPAPAAPPGFLTNMLDLVKLLLRLGHAPPEFATFGVPFLGWILEHGPGELIKRYQDFWHLPPTGALDPATEAHLALPRCAHPDVMAGTALSRWAGTHLTYWADLHYAGATDADVQADYRAALDAIEAACPALKFLPAVSANAADVLAVMGVIDGPWNVLALSELPPPDSAPGLFVAHQTFDPAEVALPRPLRVAMFCHEVCHALGLGHALPGTGNLMEPILSAAVTSPRAGDTAELALRYPGAAPGPHPDPVPVPVPTAAGPATLDLPEVILGLDDGHRYAIKVTLQIRQSP